MPKLFCGKKVVKSSTSRVSLEGLTPTATPRPCSVKAACSKSPDSCMGMGGQSDREDDLAILPILPEAVAENIAKTFEEFTLQEKVDSLSEKLAHREEEMAELQRKNFKLQKTLEEVEWNARRFCFVNVSQDPKVFRFYTGIDVEDFHDLKSMLADSVDDMTYFRRNVDADHDGRNPFHR